MEKYELFTKVKDALNEILEKKSISQNRLSTVLDVSESTLSNIQNNKVNSLSKAILYKIWNGLNNNDWTILKTHNLQDIFRACKEAKQLNRIVGLVGFTGAGKTIGLQQYYKKNDNTFLVTAHKSMRSKQFFKSILKSIGISFDGSVYGMITRIADEMNALENPLLMIDEVGKLSPTVMMYLHDLRNYTENSLGIVLCGVDYFKENLKKWTEREKEGMAEFNGRISKWYHLTRPSKEEIKAVAINNGIGEEEPVLNELMSLASDYRYLKTHIENYLMEAEN